MVQEGSVPRGRRARSPEASRMVLFKKDQECPLKSQGAIVGGGSDSPSLLFIHRCSWHFPKACFSLCEEALDFHVGSWVQAQSLASAQSAASPFPPKTPTREPISSWKEKCSLGLEGLSGKTVSVATPGFQWLG